MKRFIQTRYLASSRLALLAVAAAVMIGLVFTAGPVQSAYAAGSLTVDRTDDPAVTASGVGAAACTAAANDCSLRGATLYANANPGTTINVPAGTYPLTIDGTLENGLCYDERIGDLDIAGNNTIITGAGAAVTIIQQTRPNDRVICVDQNLVGNFNFSISGVTITGGRDTFGICGGGMVSGYPGDVTNVTNVIFSNNLTSGGATPWGGGLCNGAGALTVSGSTFSSNQASGQGGGLYYSNNGNPDTNTLSLANSTFSNNVSGANGGGILVTNTSSAYSIINSTLSGNRAAANGGGIYNGGGTAALLRNTILANSISGGNCTGTITNGGNNIDDGASCGFGSASGSMSSTNPQLGALTNGVFPLNANSPALDAGNATYCPSTDERGQARNDLQCDIGAYELKYADSPTVIRPVSSTITTTFGPALIGIRRDPGYTDPSVISVTKSLTWKTTPTNAIGAYWYITPTATSGFSLTLQLCYTPAELGALTEANLRFWRYSGGAWSQASGTPALSTVNVYRCATLSGINALSAWTLATASPNAITLNDLRATSPVEADWSWGWLLGLGVIGAAMWLLRRRAA
jgi:hypothetical protein